MTHSVKRSVTLDPHSFNGAVLSRKHGKGAMPNLTEALTSDTQKSAVVEDCLALIDAEVADKGGLTGLVIKAGYKTVQGVKPGFVRQVVIDLLPEFAQALDPLYQESRASGRGVREYFDANFTRVADALLTITDEKAKRSKSGMVKGTYEKLRGGAKKNVEAAVPRLGAMIEKHAS
jgi:hypothetical protein